MKRFILKTFILVSLLYASNVYSCSIKSIVIQSNEAVNKITKEKKLVKTFPIINSYEGFFPENVNVRVSLTGNCKKYTSAKLSLHLSKHALIKEVNHDHGDKGHHHYKKMTGTFKTISDYSAEKKLQKQKEITFKNVPHEKLYNKLSENEWYDRVRYKVELLNSESSVIGTKEVIIPSPLAD